MKAAAAAGSIWGLKAMPAVKLAWAVPVFVITALFATNGGILHTQHMQCHERLEAVTKENSDFQRRIEDGSLFAGLVGSSFKIKVSAGNEDVLRMSPRAMALQIQQLREIVDKYSNVNKRLMEEKKQLENDKEKAVDELSKKVDLVSSTATSSASSQAVCQRKLRKALRRLSSTNDLLEASKTEHLATKSKLDETTDQLKHSDASLEETKTKLQATQNQLASATEEASKCTKAAANSLPSSRSLLSASSLPAVSSDGTATPEEASPALDRSFQQYPCEATEADMKRYLDYSPRHSCPNDWYFVQRLMFKKNCFALPRRTCRVPTPARPGEPLPFPQSLFDQGALRNRNVRWDLHQYKSFEALNTRQAGDCRNCFNLSLEETRWQVPFRGALPMRDVIDMKKGTLRLGLDVGGGTGSFAAHMARFGVTVMTTAFNVETLKGAKAGLPYMETIAARGLIPLHVPHASRLPLYDGVLDVVHSVNSIKYIPLDKFEELLYEWDRVLRVGGILWFEMFYAPVEKMPKYVAAIEQMSYRKLYWNFTPKTDEGEFGGEHVYLNCVLEKQPYPGKDILAGPPKEDMKDIV